MTGPFGMLSKAKAATSGLAEQTQSDSGAIAEKMQNIRALRGDTDAAPAPKSAPTTYKPNPAGRYGTRPGEKRIDTTEMTRPLGSFKKGGKVKKTGTYKLHKGEVVANPKQSKKIAAKGGMKALFGK